MFFDNDDRYDGFWEDDLPHGDGRMIYSNGDVYEGQWYLGKRNGYGVLTKYVIVFGGLIYCLGEMEIISKENGLTIKEKVKALISTAQKTRYLLENG
jgi:hypothetical protein